LCEGDARLEKGSDFTHYVKQVILLDAVITTNNLAAIDKIKAQCQQKGISQPTSRALTDFFLAHWKEWVKLNMKNIRREVEKRKVAQTDGAATGDHLLPLPPSSLPVTQAPLPGPHSAFRAGF
jgi:hypothetical protein